MSPEPLMPVETYGGIQQGTGKVRNHQIRDTGTNWDKHDHLL